MVFDEALVSGSASGAGRGALAAGLWALGLWARSSGRWPRALVVGEGIGMVARGHVEARGLGVVALGYRNCD